MLLKLIPRFLIVLKKSEKKCEEYTNEIESILQELSTSALKLMDDKKAYLNDPWLSNLDWTVKPVKMTKEIVSVKGHVLKPFIFVSLYFLLTPQPAGKQSLPKDIPTNLCFINITSY